MAFTINHTVRFDETDAAGVVYFANELVICHGAYEASLAAAGIDLRHFFRSGPLGYPIVRATIDFNQPMYCGDPVTIWLEPERTNESGFEIRYQLTNVEPDRPPLAQAITHHVCINTETRQRHPLPPAMEAWLQRWGA